MSASEVVPGLSVVLRIPLWAQADGNEEWNKRCSLSFLNDSWKGCVEIVVGLGGVFQTLTCVHFSVVHYVLFIISIH